MKCQKKNKNVNTKKTLKRKIPKRIDIELPGFQYSKWTCG